MGDSRGDPSHLTSWSKQKGVDPECFEVVVVTDENDPETSIVQQHLRPHDSLVTLSVDRSYVAGKEMPAYKHAFENAKGRYVLLTEDHVVAHSDCLASIVSELDRHPESDGFALNSGHINRSRFAEAEGAIYDQSIEHWYRPESWDRIRQRGTLIRRDLVEAVGGIPIEFGLFGELLLSLRLWKKDARINLLKSAKIRHVNLQNLSFFEKEIRNFVEGKINYLLTSRAEDTEFFGIDQGITRGLLFHPSLHAPFRRVTRKASGEIGKKFSPYGKRQFRLFSRELIRQSSFLSFPVNLIFRCRALLKLSMIRLRFGGADKATERMLSLWYETADHSSQIALRGKSHPFEVITINSPESVSQLPFAATFGFDALEQVKGEPEFRWAGLVSGIHFDLDSGPHSIVLSLANVRNPASSIATIAFFNEEKVESKDVVQTDDEIIFKVESPDSGHSRFLLFCDPLEAPDDFRSLGLPITGIRVLSPDPE